MSAKVILNPYSGRGRAGRARNQLERALNEFGLAYDLELTAGPLDAMDLAAQAVSDGFTPIVAAGGDGLTSEVINGMMRAAGSAELPPLGLIPLGTANDLANNLKLPTTIEEAVGGLSSAAESRIDLGQAGEWYFANNSAVGLEPVVTLYNIEMVRLRGVIRYLVAALRAIAAGTQYQMTVQWDDGQYQGPLTLVSVGNCPLTGGLFRMTPAADPADGLLTFIYAYVPNRLKMLALLPRTLNGSHVEDGAVHQRHTRKLRIEASTPTPLQVDGEIRASELTDITYRLLPGRLRLLDPTAAA